MRRAPDLHLLGAITLGAFLRLAGTNGYDLWADEIHTQLLSESNLSALLTPAFIAPYTPLYFLLAKAWTLLAGASEGAIRLFPVACGLALIPILRHLGDALHGETAGRAAGWIAAAHPLLVYFSREHRMYPLYLLAMAGSALLFLRIDDRPPPRGEISAAAAAAAAFLSFPFALLYLPALLLFARDRRGLLRRGAALAPAVGIAVVWMLCLVGRVSADRNAYYGRFDGAQAGNAVKTFLIGNFSMTHADLRPAAYTAIALGLVLIVGGLLHRRPNGPALRAGTAFVLLPYLAIVLLQIRMGSVYNYKSFLPGVLAAILLVANGVAACRPRLGAVALVALLGLSLWVDRALLDRSHRYNWTTSREVRYVRLRDAVRAEAPEAAGAGAWEGHEVFHLLYYGGIPRRPIYADPERFYEYYPAMNRPHLEAMLTRAGVRAWSDLPASAGPIVVFGTVPSGAVAGRTVLSDTPLHGVSLILSPWERTSGETDVGAIRL